MKNNGSNVFIQVMLRLQYQSLEECILTDTTAQLYGEKKTQREFIVLGSQSCISITILPHQILLGISRM